MVASISFGMVTIFLLKAAKAQKCTGALLTSLIQLLSRSNLPDFVIILG